MSDLLSPFDDLLATLDDAYTDQVRTAIASGMAEGWRPGRDEIQALCDVTTGRITRQEYLDWLVDPHREAV